MKKLHRDILLSATYRQSSDYREDVAKADPENKLLAVFPRKRLEAEEIRDSILVASGKLNEHVGGPSVFPPIPANLIGGGNFNRPIPPGRRRKTRRTIRGAASTSSRGAACPIRCSKPSTWRMRSRFTASAT